jgi:hypothetical protein
MTAKWPRLAPFIAVTLLALLAFLLHRSALAGFWRADDGNHLLFAVEHAPWEYFLRPSVMAAQSGANLTPFNVLFYDINLALFGMVPQGHYAHLLLLIGATVAAVFVLLRRWLPVPYAFLGALFYVLGPPTFYVAQHLMTGHYAGGLLLATLSLHAFLKGSQEDRAGWVLWGAVLYGLAALSKELYVPLLGLLPFIGPGDWRARLRRTIPYLIVAIAYFGLRFVVLGSLVGGYFAVVLSATERAMQLARIPLLLFGDHRWGYFGLALVGVLLAWSLVSWRALRIPFVIGAILLVGPLVPLTAFPGIVAPDRYVYALWWGLSLLLASGLERLARQQRPTARALAWALVPLLVAAVAVQHVRYKHALGDENALNDSLYRTVFTSTPNQFVLPPPEGAGYFHSALNDAVAAERHLNPGSPLHARVIANYEDPILEIGPGAQLLEFDRGCRCMRDISGRLPALRLQAQAALKQYLPGKALEVRFEYLDGRMVWTLGPQRDGRYRVVDAEGKMYDVGLTGSYAWPPHRPLKFRVDFLAKEGWRARTPYFEFDPGSRPVVAWSGPSIAAPELAMP